MGLSDKAGEPKRWCSASHMEGKFQKGESHKLNQRLLLSRRQGLRASHWICQCEGSWSPQQEQVRSSGSDETLTEISSRDNARVFGNSDIGQLLSIFCVKLLSIFFCTKKQVVPRRVCAILYL